jgi:hypothetical protein
VSPNYQKRSRFVSSIVWAAICAACEIWCASRVVEVSGCYHNGGSCPRRTRDAGTRRVSGWPVPQLLSIELRELRNDSLLHSTRHDRQTDDRLQPLDKRLPGPHFVRARLLTFDYSFSWCCPAHAHNPRSNREHVQTARRSRRRRARTRRARRWQQQQQPFQSSQWRACADPSTAASTERLWARRRHSRRRCEPWWRTSKYRSLRPTRRQQQHWRPRQSCVSPSFPVSFLTMGSRRTIAPGTAPGAPTSREPMSAPTATNCAIRNLF